MQISVRSTLSDLSSSIDETREVATDLSIEHQRLAAELERMERAVAMSNGKPLPSLPPTALPTVHFSKAPSPQPTVALDFTGLSGSSFTCAFTTMSISCVSATTSSCSTLSITLFTAAGSFKASIECSFMSSATNNTYAWTPDGAYCPGIGVAE